jgi:Zn-dependent peptidase ImmA (M78 family)
VASKIYEPEEYARELLSSLSLSRIQNLDEILCALKLKVVERNLNSVDGILVRKSGKGIIAIKQSIKEIGRKNFTICHEIGHYILPGHGTVACKSDEIESWKSNLLSHEVEANKFASELLLPTSAIFPLVERNGANISLIKEIANDFQTSLTAAAFKCIAITEERCALIWSIDGQIKWFTKSESFRCYLPMQRLDSDSLACQLSRAIVSQVLEGEVYADAWIEDDSLSSNDKVWEESISLPAYNGVLTILTLESRQ